MTLTLYTNPMSRGRIVRWMLEEIGTPYLVNLLDYGTTMKAPEYLALNPMGKVPALAHEGQVITETAAICLYLADAFPLAGMIGQNRAAYFRWILFAAGPLEAAVTNNAMGLTPPLDKQAMVGYGSYEVACKTLETAVSGAGFIAGDQFSAADVYVGSQIGYGLHFGTIPATPALTAYWDRIKDRPARLRAEAADDALMPE